MVVLTLCSSCVRMVEGEGVRVGRVWEGGCFAVYHFIIRDLPLKLEQLLATWRRGGGDTRKYLKSTNLLRVLAREKRGVVVMRSKHICGFNTFL